MLVISSYILFNIYETPTLALVFECALFLLQIYCRVIFLTSNMDLSLICTACLLAKISSVTLLCTCHTHSAKKHQQVW